MEGLLTDRLSETIDSAWPTAGKGSAIRPRRRRKLSHKMKLLVISTLFVIFALDINQVSAPGVASCTYMRRPKQARLLPIPDPHLFGRRRAYERRQRSRFAFSFFVLHDVTFPMQSRVSYRKNVHIMSSTNPFRSSAKIIASRRRNTPRKISSANGREARIRKRIRAYRRSHRRRRRH